MPKRSKLPLRGRPSQKKVSKGRRLLTGAGTRKKSPLIIFISIFVGIGIYIVWTSFAASNPAPPSPFVDKPERGLIWAGLKSPQAGSVCGRLYELVNAHGRIPMCTHGPDPAPEGIDARVSVEPVRTGENDRTAPESTPTPGTAAASYPIPCDGDGNSGSRVQGLYVRASDRPSRLATYASSFQTWAIRTNDAYINSSLETGSARNIRWVHDASCQPVVPEVVIPPTGDDDLNNTINELQKLGYNRTDRKYLLWVDAEIYCGIATIYADDEPGGSNINNSGYTSYGRTDSGCWGYAEPHELMHNLGAVQASAPHATKGWHCTDERDEMCYVDGSGVVLTTPCPTATGTNFDCNHDDYYYAGVPPIGNYLYDHWNTANSSFLIGGGVTPTSVQCNNGRDDDGDGKIDYPADPGCTGSSDPSESPDPIAPPPPPDTIAPTVTITSPINNAKVKGRVSISANGTDNKGITKMEIYIDGVQKANFSYPYISYTWSTSKASSGAHSITVKAYDAAGNMGQSSVSVFK